MNRSLLLAFVVGFGVIAMQVGSVEAKNVKGQSPSRCMNPIKTCQNQGGHLVSEPVHLGPATPVKSVPPVWSKLNPNDFKARLPQFTITHGGNPPRAPQPNCGHHGCDHDGCDHYCDWHHDCHRDCHRCDWMFFFGDMCYGDYFGNTCSDFDFDFCW